MTFGGGTLSVTSGFTTSTGKVFTVSSDLTGTLDIASGQTFTIANAANLVTTGDTASVLYKTGAGALVIQAANASFDGTMQINAGTVELRDAQSLGDATNRGRITLNSGTLNLRNDASTNFANNVTVTANSTIDVDRLTGTTPAVTHTLGTLSIGANTLTMSGGNGAALTFGAVTLTGAATFNPTTADATLGAVSGSFGFTKTGAGTLILNGTSSYTGTTTISVGTLRLGVAGGVSATSAVSIASGAIFDANNLNAAIGSLTGAGNVTLGSGILTTGGNNSSTTFSGIISGTGGLTKTGSGIFTLSGANTYTGATTISGGTLKLGVAGGIPSTSALSVNVGSGATFDLNNFNSTIGSLTGAGSVSLGSGTLSAGGDNSTTTFSGIIGGSGGFTKSGTGVFTLSGANTFTGTTNVSAGVIVVQNPAALGTAAGGTVVASGAELRIAGGTSVGAEALTLNGTGASGAGALRVVSGTSSWGGNITLGSAATIGVDAGQLTLGGTIGLGANALTFTGAGATQSNGIISGSGALVKNGTGTLALFAANTFTGTTTINAGAINVQDGAAFGAAGAGAVTVVSGAALQLNNASGIIVGNKSLTLNGTGIGGAGAIDSILGNNSWAGNLTLASDSTIAVEADSLTLSGAIGESGGVRAFTKIGTGTLVLGGNNTYTGATAINAGTLAIAGSERIGDFSAVTVASGATLDLNDSDETIGSLAGAGSVMFGTQATASLTTGGNNTSTTFSGVLSEYGDLIKTGTGTLTLSGANTFIGGVYLNGGVLSINTDAQLGDSTNPIDFGGGTLQLTAATTTARTITLSVGGTIDTAGVNSTISSAISGAGWLTKIGTGTLNLTAANTYTGLTDVQAGTLSLGHAGGTIADTAAVQVSGGTLNVANSDTVGAVTLSSGTITGAGTLTGSSYNLTNTGSISAVLAGNVSLTKTGAGTATLSAANTFGGSGQTVNINGGSLQVSADNNLGNAANSLSFDGGTLLFSNGFSITRNVALNAGGGTINTGNNAVTLANSGVISGSGALTKIGHRDTHAHRHQYLFGRDES